MGMTVPDDDLSPLVLRRRLRGGLRQARQDTELTQGQVAAAMDWSLSKVIRIESGANAISTNDLRALLSLYQITDPGEVQDLVELARAARERSWWSTYKDAASPDFLRYVEQEASASALRAYEHVVIHGLLQTEEYAAWVIREFLGELYTDQQTDRRVELRMKRQELLGRAGPPELQIIHDEAVLRRIVGSPAVMRRQLQHLADLAERPGITLNVLPFTAGVRDGFGESFAILDFPGMDDPALFTEPYDTIREYRSEQVARYEERFQRFRSASPGRDESACLIRSAARTMR
jgi:transcriptional regulator with XRE-family HTH domain